MMSRVTSSTGNIDISWPPLYPRRQNLKETDVWLYSFRGFPKRWDDCLAGVLALPRKEAADDRKSSIFAESHHKGEGEG